MKEADFRNSRLSQFFCSYCLNPLWAQRERRPAQRDQLRVAAGGNTCTAAKTEALAPRRCRTELPRVTERRAGELACGLRCGQVLTLAGCSRFPPPHPRRERCLCWLIHSHWLACSLEEERGEVERGVEKRDRWINRRGLLHQMLESEPWTACSSHFTDAQTGRAK